MAKFGLFNFFGSGNPGKQNNNLSSTTKVVSTSFVNETTNQIYDRQISHGNTENCCSLFETFETATLFRTLKIAIFRAKEFSRNKKFHNSNVKIVY